MEASKKIARMSIALLFLCAALSALATSASAQNPVPALSINGFSGQRDAQVTASSPAAVSFTGNYTVDKLSFERAVVTFTATVSTGWAATVSPATVIVAGNGGRQGLVTVTVVVPAGTLVTEIGQVTLIGRATAGGLQSVPAQAQGVIVPSPYFRVIASSTNPFMESSYSSQVAIAYKIYNEGNVKDQVRVSIEKLDELSADGWSVVLSRTSFQIEPTLFQDIQVTVALPKEWHLYSDNKVKIISLIVTSGGAAEQGGSFTDTLPVFIRTVGFSSPGPEMPLIMMGTIMAAMLMGSTRRVRRLRIVK